MPQLLLARSVTVVVTVVADTQVAFTCAIPIGEEHRQGAPAGSQRERLCKTNRPTRRQEQLVLCTEVLVRIGGAEIAADGDRREVSAVVPASAERCVPGIAPVEIP